MAPIVIIALPGVTTTVTAGRIVTVADALLVGSACEVAVTETFGGDGTVVGAVYKPLLLTVPHAEPEHPAPYTLQLTAVSVEPVTVAVNCLYLPHSEMR